jgi:Na+/glutamate symporter
LFTKCAKITPTSGYVLLLKFLQVATIVGIFIDYCWLCKFIFSNFLVVLSPSQLLFSDSFLSHSQLRQGGNLVLPQSASSAFLLVQVSVVALLHRLLQEVHGFGFGFCGGCLGFEGGHGFCGGWGGEGVGGGGFVAAGATKDLVTTVGVGGCWGSLGKKKKVFLIIF